MEADLEEYDTFAENARAKAIYFQRTTGLTTIAEAARKAAEESSPAADNRGSEDYKRDMVRVLTARALRRSVERAGGPGA